MQDALPALVLNSEALKPTTMNDTPPTPPPQLAPPATSTSCSPSPKAPPNPSTNSSSATNNPSTASSVAAPPTPITPKSSRKKPFLVLLRAAARYEPRALFRTYLYAIAFKILRAHRRKAAFRATFFGQPKSIPDPAKQDATESGLWVRRAVEKLDRIDREVLLLREFEQLSYAEIADLLQLPINTVRSRLFRARTALRNLLEPSAAPAPNEAPPSAEQPHRRAPRKRFHRKASVYEHHCTSFRARRNHGPPRRRTLARPVPIRFRSPRLLRNLPRTSDFAPQCFAHTLQLDRRPFAGQREIR